jgi:hypothetical protein
MPFSSSMALNSEDVTSMSAKIVSRARCLVNRLVEAMVEAGSVVVVDTPVAVAAAAADTELEDLEVVMPVDVVVLVVEGIVVAVMVEDMGLEAEVEDTVMVEGLQEHQLLFQSHQMSLPTLRLQAVTRPPLFLSRMYQLPPIS